MDIRHDSTIGRAGRKAGSGCRDALTAGVLVVGFLVALASGRAFAAPVSVEQAQLAVQGWIRTDGAPLGTGMGRTVKRVDSFSDAAGSVLYHVVYLDPSGFVIVAADDLIEPIIAFAPHGQFDPSSKNPLGALVSKDLPGRHASVKGIQVASASGVPSPAKHKWALLAGLSQAGGGLDVLGIGTVSDVRVPPFVQSEWAQSTVDGDPSGDACYNYYTPPYAAGTSSNYVSGCVATAMAQLMRYWLYPVIGVGTNAFPISVAGAGQSSSLRGGDGSGGPYDWASMPLASPSTLTQRRAIGALTYDAGVAAQMAYNDDAHGGSSASLGTAKDVLISTFGYANGVHDYNPLSSIKSTGLIGMVNPNLDAGYPVILGISGVNGGHAAVCDGYGYNLGTLYHHLNLGWWGLENAWYSLPAIDTAYPAPSFTVVDECVYNVWTNGAGEIVSGRVVDGGGIPLGGVVVTAALPGGGTYSTTTSSNGIYSFARIPSCTQYALNAGKAGCAFAEQLVATDRSVDFADDSGNQWGVNFTQLPAAFLYTNISGTIAITGHTGPVAAIPGTIDGLPVTRLGANAFSGCAGLTNVAIPRSVTNIGSYAFSGCTNLITVTIGASVTTNGDGAFSGCTRLTSVYCHGNAPGLGASVFNGVTNATIYYLSSTSSWGSTFGGLRTELLPYQYTTANGAITIAGYTSTGGVVAIPGMIDGLPVTRVGSNAFYSLSSLTGVTIPATVTSIGDNAFCYCFGLTGLTISGGVSSIGDWALFDCVHLAKVYFSGSAPRVGWQAFDYDTNATAFYLPCTTGWGPTLGILPTALWNPHAQSDVSFGVRTNRFGFTIAGSTNFTIVVEACTNLVSPVWSAVGTNTLSGGLSYFTDSKWTNSTRRFYRFRSP